MTYRDFHTPELSSHFARHLQCNLGAHRHERLSQSTGNHTLAGSGTLHTEEPLDGVVLVLPVSGEDHHYLTDGENVKVSCIQHMKCDSID